MKLSDKLRARRADISEAMRTLVDLAASEDRDLTTEERTLFDGHKGEKAALDRRIADAVAVEEETRATATPAAPAIIRTDDGTEIRLLRPSDRLADLFRHEGPPLSLGRMVRGVALNDWTGADRERRAVMESGASGAGFAVPTPVAASILDLARNSMVTVRMGALSVPMESSTLSLPRQLTDPTAYWRAEGTAITLSNPTFDAVSATAHAVAIRVDASVEVYEDAPGMPSAVDNAIAKALALAADAAALNGSGPADSMPVGVARTPGVGNVPFGADGAAPTSYDEIIQAIALIQGANYTPTGLALSSRTQKGYSLLKNTLNDPLSPPAAAVAFPWLVSNQLPDDGAVGTSGNVCSTAILGQWDQLALCFRTNFTLEATRFTQDGFDKLMIALRGYLRMDAVVLRAAAFVKLTGIKDVAVP